MKRLLSLLLALVLVIGMIPVQANAETLDNGLVYDIYADHVEITDYTGDATEIVIPSKIKKIPVTVICDMAFYGCSSLTDIELPDGLTYIGDSAFANCSGLTGIEIPDSVTYIDHYAFSGCSSLTGIEIPDSVTAINYGTFGDCSSLTCVNLPDSITYIGADAFIYCSNLTDIVIPDSVTSIDYRAFSGCYNLTNIVIPDGITHISADTFFGCSRLTRVEIPDSVTYIGDMAFFSCYDLTSIEIPDSVTYIGDSAFFNCGELTTMNIPAGVTYIGVEAFTACESLTGIHVDENNPNYSSDDRGILFDKAKTRLICAPGGIEGTYTIPDGVTEIGYSAFSGCSNLTGVEIPDSVTEIGACAFSRCESLTSIDLPIGITYIDIDTFLACYSLSSIEIPCGVTYIGRSAFHSCKNLTDIYFTGDAPVFEDSIFYSVSATAHYPDGNTTWTADVRRSYGGYLRWTPYTAPVHTHEYTSTVHTPTCTRTGLTVYTCICADRYVADYVDPLGHEYADGACTRCGKAESDDQEPTRPSDPGNGMFPPEDTMTRGTFVYALWNYFGSPEPYFINRPFTDVSESDYYHDAVYWAVESGILSGTNPIKFGPDAYMNRAQTATFLWRAFGSPEPATEYIPFTDVDTDAWYTDAVIWAWEEGYMRALDYTHFGPNERCTYNHINWISDESSEEEPDFCYLVLGDCVEITGCKGEVTDLVIPAEINGLPVTSIRDQAFHGCSSLTSIELPDTITSIGESAFSYCSSLTRVEIPDSITSIGDTVFSSCSSLTSIEIPDSVTCIGDGAFFNCSKLASIEIPDGVTYIGEDAFHGCAVLTDIVIPDSVTYIGEEAFSSCEGLTSIEIPYGVTHIGDRAFLYCSSLTGIHVDENNLNYSSDDRGVLFDKAQILLIQAPTTIAGAYTVPDSVTFIGECSFTHCADLTGIEVPDTLISIGEDSFAFCSSLTGIELPNGVTYIGDGAFSLCLCLTSIKIPDSVTSIGNDLFLYCDSLTSVEIPDSVTSIGNHAFDRCDQLTSIEIPDSVTSIGYSAFSGCANLTSIYFNGDAPVFGNGAFKDVTATAYYPADNATWTADVMQSCGDQLNWVPYTPNPFTDVPAGEWFYEPVLWALENGITTGTSEGSFSPENQCLRAQVVTFLWRAKETPEPSPSTVSFTDVTATDFFYKPVLWAVEKGITTGISSARFGSYDVCNRAQVVTFLWRAAGSPEPQSTDNPFTDVKTTDFFYKSVLWAVENGITNGMTTTKFGPNAACNRAQVVTFLYRAYND